MKKLNIYYTCKYSIGLKDAIDNTQKNFDWKKEIIENIISLGLTFGIMSTFDLSSLIFLPIIIPATYCAVILSIISKSVIKINNFKKIRNQSFKELEEVVYSLKKEGINTDVNKIISSIKMPTSKKIKLEQGILRKTQNDILAFNDIYDKKRLLIEKRLQLQNVYGKYCQTIISVEDRKSFVKSI